MVILTVTFVSLILILVLSELVALDLITLLLGVKTIISINIDTISLEIISLLNLISLELALAELVIDSFPILTELLLLLEIFKFVLKIVYY